MDLTAHRGGLCLSGGLVCPIWATGVSKYMRFLPPVVRPLAIRFGQTGLALSLGVLAMAAAPLGAATQPVLSETVSEPVDAPVLAIPRPADPMVRKLQFEAPLKGYKINSKFGLRKLAIEAKARAHKGVDIAAPTGTSVHVTGQGRVVRAGYQAGGYGNFIEVKHPNGMTSLYAHLSRIHVRQGQKVTADQVIGQVGSTGYSTGPHLHFEVRQNGRQVNPAKIVGSTYEVKIDPAALRNASS